MKNRNKKLNNQLSIVKTSFNELMRSVTPGSGEYAIGSPFFNYVKIHLPKGKIFAVVAENCSKKNRYAKSASLNSEELKRPFISHKDITDGG
jgi:putative alpha-1,2-mannosidase